MIQKSTSWLRWPILVLACLMLIGSYYCFDIPAAIKTQIDDYFGDPSEYETYFSLMYTLYAAPNVILPFFGGFFVDRFGVRICLLIFTSLIALGQLLFSLGVSIKSWPLIFVGRLVFGFGGESLSVANTALVAQWFYGKELAFAFGINLAVAKLGSVINNVTSPALAESDGVIFACWFGAILCAMSVGTVLIASPIDKWMDQQIADEAKRDEDAGLKASLIAERQDDGGDKTINSVAAPEDEVDTGNVSVRDISKFSVIFWVLSLSCVVVYGAVIPFNNISSSLLLERDYFTPVSSSCTLHNPYQCQNNTNLPQNCPASRWSQVPLPLASAEQPLMTSCGTFVEPLTASDIDCTQTCWSDGCTAEYCTRLAAGEKQASLIMSIPYIISAVMSPVLGLAVDRFGCRAIIATIAPALLVIVHFLLAYSDVDPVGPLVGQGLAYTGFAAVLWPAVPLVIPPSLIGLGFGVVTSMQNLSCAIIPLIAAAIFSDSGDRYIPYVEVLFASLGLVGFLVGIYMNYYDYFYNNSVLNRGATETDAAVLQKDRRHSSDEPRNPIHPNGTSPVLASKSEGVGLYSPVPVIASSPSDVIPVRTFSGAGLLSGAAGVGATAAHQLLAVNREGRSRSVSRDRTASRDRAQSSDTRREAALRALAENT